MDGLQLTSVMRREGELVEWGKYQVNALRALRATPDEASGATRVSHLR